MKIYTKTGDNGTTSLFDGTRVDKDHLRVEAYGDIDELNAMLGVVMAPLKKGEEMRSRLLNIQRDLFALGAQLANPRHKKQKSKSDFGKEKIEEIEKAIDALEEECGPITTFILPGGSFASAFLELARTVCRRAERRMICLNRREALDPVLLIYINRLSDLLFMMARGVNKKLGVLDILWDQ